MSLTRSIVLTLAVLSALTVCVLALPDAAPAKPGFVVLCPFAWMGQMTAYIKFRSVDFDARCVALEDVTSTGPGVDAPERIKRYLYREWREHNLRYALLVGDASTFPVRWMVLDRNTEPAFNYAFYACDLYYADLARADGSFDDWNAQKDGFHAGYYGEVRGEHFKVPPINYDAISYVPEIAVGRWPVSTPAELDAVVAKTLEWERLSHAGPPRVLLAHSGGWIDARPQIGALGDALAKIGWDTERQYWEGTPVKLSPASIKASILAGKDMVLHAGHGSDQVWDGTLGPAERDALAVATPAIFFSVGCGTAHFATEPPYNAYLDTAGLLHRGTVDGEVFKAEPPPPAPLQPGRFSSWGLGTRLVTMPRGGAIAYIGCNTGAQPCGLSLLDGFVKSIADGSGRVGDAWKDAVAYYWKAEKLPDLVPNDDWYPPSIFFQGMKFMLFGDPTASVPRARK